MKIRCFVCVELPPSERSRLGDLQTQLRRHGARISWGAPDTIHLTLAFLGDVETAATPAIAAALDAATAPVAAFRLRLRGTGGFPSLERPRVLWVGVDGDVASLSALERSIRRRLDPLGFADDGRPYSPHLTLGRVKDPRGEGIPRVAHELRSSEVEGDPFGVHEVVLMRSELDPRGARHSPLHRSTLGAPA